MAQRQGRSWFRSPGLITTGLAAALLLGPGAVSAGGGHHHGHHGGHHHHDDDDDDDGQRYKGSETLELVSVGLNPVRCGAAPNFEAVFEGSGIDTAGGVFDVVSSGCQNIVTGEVTDLTAVDTYLNGDSITIIADSFFLVFNPQTCVSSNEGAVDYSIGGGTGAFAGATGGGKFDIASNDPACSGALAPAFVWFRGRIH